MRCTAAEAISPRMIRACTSALAPPKQSIASRFAGLLERSRRSPLWPPTNSIPCSKVRELCLLTAFGQLSRKVLENPIGANMCFGTASTIMESEDAALLRLGETYLIEWEQARNGLASVKEGLPLVLEQSQ